MPFVRVTLTTDEDGVYRVSRATMRGLSPVRGHNVPELERDLARHVRAIVTGVQDIFITWPDGSRSRIELK